MTEIPYRVLQRVVDRVPRGQPKECWIWPMSVGSHGYGQIGWTEASGRNRAVTAHHALWTALYGPVSDGFVVDHICHNRPCCNPSHLRLLTRAENARGHGKHLKTHCPRGHAYEGEDLYVTSKGHRKCRACARILWKERLNAKA